MRNLYLTDIRRTLKDKLFLVTCILAGVFAVINPLLNNVLFKVLDLGELMGSMVYAKSMLFTSFLPSDNIGLIMPILVAVIVCKDFGHGTVRNKIICGRSRAEIFLSHWLSSATVMCAVMLLQGLLTLGVSLCFFSYQPEAFGASDLGFLILSLVFEMVVYLAVAAVVTLIAVISKSTGVCVLLYLAVAFGASIVGAIFKMAGSSMDPSGSLYNVIELINALNIYTSMLIGAGTSYTAKQVVYILLAPAVITAGGTLLGLRLFARKNLK